MRTLTFLMLGASALAIAGCTELPGSRLGATFGAERYLNMQHGGEGSFNDALAMEYSEVARHYAFEDVRWMPATAFIAKAKAAEAGNTPAPWTPAELGVNGDATQLYDQVVATISANRDARPAACARAQAMWDWYLAVLRGEGFGARCSMSSEDIRALLDEALAACAAPPGPVNYVVYFGFDLWNLTDAARGTLDEAVGSIQSMGTQAVSVVGHTDTMGSVQYNQGLSERRAGTVADYLEMRGVPRGAMTLAGRSELEPAVQTGDQVREPLNRRVEITLSP